MPAMWPGIHHTTIARIASSHEKNPAIDKPVGMAHGRDWSLTRENENQ